MKNLIEEAARRLEQLAHAGITPPRPVDKPVSDAKLRASAPLEPVFERREPTIGAERPPAAANVRAIDLARLQSKGYLTSAVSDSTLLHEFRVIKRPLIQNALDKAAAPIANANLVMVTSSLPGEGKSFVAINLAMSIAMEVDCGVLLVDGDVLKPALPEVLGVAPGQGLLDLMTAPGLSIDEVLLKTNVPRLDLLLAGTKQRAASELLASDAMKRLLQEISRRYPDRVVVFDSPPLLSTTESRILANLMGQVVVVVEAERTTHGALEAALSTVEGCPVVMTMLNKAPGSESGPYYRYHDHAS